jgi:hypothetical protein
MFGTFLPRFMSVGTNCSSMDARKRLNPGAQIK